MDLDDRVVTPSYIARHQAPLWAYNMAGEIVERFMPDYDFSNDSLPDIVFVPPVKGDPEIFGGRHYPDKNAIAIYDSVDPFMLRAIVAHEMTHWMRKRQGDPLGKHDKDFYALVERVYASQRVDRTVRRHVEQVCGSPGSYCGHW